MKKGSGDLMEQEDQEVIITTTELKKNLDKYLELSKTQKISITENGQVISILSSPTVDKLEIVKRLKGCMGEVGDIDWDKVRYERLVEKYGKF